MESNAPPSVRRLAFGDLEHELDTTRRHLSRMPSDRLGWSPHEKSYTLGQLGAHIANLVNWMRITLEADGFDLAEPQPDGQPPESTDEILERFDAARTAFEEAWEAVEDPVLMEPWTLRDGEHEIMTMPKLATLRTFTLSHMIHHRGQLTVYLRLLGESVPPSYGPSADEELDV